MRINDLINKNALHPRQAIEALTSFSAAEEGTNILFTGLVQVISKSTQET